MRSPNPKPPPTKPKAPQPLNREVAIHTDLAHSVDVALLGQALTVQARSSEWGHSLQALGLTIVQEHM